MTGERLYATATGSRRRTYEGRVEKKKSAADNRMQASPQTRADTSVRKGVLTTLMRASKAATLRSRATIGAVVLAIAARPGGAGAPLQARAPADPRDGRERRQARARGRAGREAKRGAPTAAPPAAQWAGRGGALGGRADQALESVARSASGARLPLFSHRTLTRPAHQSRARVRRVLQRSNPALYTAWWQVGGPGEEGGATNLRVAAKLDGRPRRPLDRRRPARYHPPPS